MAEPAPQQETSHAPVFVLVHSPLVGPSTWQPVARELQRHDRAALVPSLLGVAGAPVPQWQYVCRVVKASTQHLAGPIVLVGHSGAGLLLPAIADAVSAPVAATIFVDAFLPPATGTVELLPQAFLDQLRALADDGVLPPWSQWFGDEAMRDLVPDDQTRARLVEEMARLPLSYFEGAPPAPEGWDRRPCAYMLFSDEPYAAAAADAKARGWPVSAMSDAKHFHLVTHPQAVAAALLALDRALVPVESLPT